MSLPFFQIEFRDFKWTFTSLNNCTNGFNRFCKSKPSWCLQLNSIQIRKLDRPVKDDAQNPLNNIQLSISGAFKQVQGSLIWRNDMRLCTPNFLRIYKIRRVKFKNKTLYLIRIIYSSSLEILKEALLISIYIVHSFNPIWSWKFSF